MVIRSIGILSLGKLMGLMYAGIGALFGVLYALFALIGGGAMMAMGGGGEAFSGGMMMGMGLAAVIVLPIFYGLLGFLAGLLSAWLYNLAAKYVGGVEVDIQ